MKNMNQLMKQAKKMQEDIMKAQEALGEQTVLGTAGGGAVKIVMDGHKQVKEVTLDKEVVTADDTEMLQDLILAAFQDAMQKVEELTESQLGQYTRGLNMPGMI